MGYIFHRFNHQKDQFYFLARIHLHSHKFFGIVYVRYVVKLLGQLTCFIDIICILPSTFHSKITMTMKAAELRAWLNAEDCFTAAPTFIAILKNVKLRILSCFYFIFQ